MRSFFHRLLHGQSASSDTQGSDKTAELKPPLPVQHLEKSIPQQHIEKKAQSFVRREAVINRMGKTIGYEFSLLTQLKERLTRLGGLSRSGFDSALLTRLVMVEKNTSLLQDRLAFVNLALESLDNPLLDELPVQNTVLMLELGNAADFQPSALERLQQLKEKGFLVGARIDQAEALEHPLVEHAEFIQLVATAFDGLALQDQIKRLKKKNQQIARSQQIIVSQVQSHDDFQFCLQCEFDLFQGVFIGQRSHFSARKSKINRAIVLPVLNMVRKDVDFSLIADQLKNEPILTFKLLRYLNSPAMGLPQRVDSLTRALVVLGREKFYRWLSLLIFDFTDPTYQERALAEQSLARGRTLELLAGQGQVPDTPDAQFLIGLFSLLDVAMGQPLPDLLAQANLPDVVRDTLMNRAGPHADALALVVLGEANATEASVEALTHALTQCGLDDHQFLAANRQAIDWAHQLLGEVAA